MARTTRAGMENLARSSRHTPCAVGWQAWKPGPRTACADYFSIGECATTARRGSALNRKALAARLPLDCAGGGLLFFSLVLFLGGHFWLFLGLRRRFLGAGRGDRRSLGRCGRRLV